MRRIAAGLLFLMMAAWWSCCDAAPAQEGDETEKPTVLLQFPGEHDLATLVDYVSQRLQIKIMYDGNLATRKINIRAPKDVPVESLLGVLQSALRMNGLALIDTNTPGWKRVVDVARLHEGAVEQDAQSAIKKSGGETPVTQVFVLQHADPAQLEQSIRPFLSSGSTTGVPTASANILALKEQRMLIVTDFASNIVRLERLIKLIDQPRESVVTRFVPTRVLDAKTLSEKIEKLLDARRRASGQAPDATASRGAEVAFDERTNKVILVGTQQDVQHLEEYLKTLDVPVDIRTEVYAPRRLAAERLQRIVTSMLEVRESRPVFRVAVDEDQNLLIVSTTDAFHLEIESILQRLDTSVAETDRNSPVRYYKLKYATADELLGTIRNLEGALRNGQKSTAAADKQTQGRFDLDQSRNSKGVSRPETAVPDDVMSRSGQLPQEVVDKVAGAAAQLNGPRNEPTAQKSELTVDVEPKPLSITEAVGRARITADAAANMLIIVATPDVHEVYADLIKKLDQPRPQVMIEAKLVVIDTSDDFTLGVEFSAGDRSGPEKLFAFSSYGFSEVNRTTGALSILPGLGFNGVLVDPSVADVILRAVSNHRRAKVISSPRILVNDHATGYLTSVTEVPFSSFNTFNNVSSTSFAGYAEAGTTVTVTPHISEGEQLNLEYTFTMNAFQASASTSGPPPRQTDEIESTVTIPDGHTIIVGGLNRSNHAVTRDSIPFLEQIPIVEYLISKNTSQMSGTTLFVFIRPVILRDDKFRDLKMLSERDTGRANVPGTFPQSRPILVR